MMPVAFRPRSCKGVKYWLSRSSVNFGSPAIWQPNSSSLNSGRKRMPLSPMAIASAKASKPIPFGAQTPNPVITTRSAIFSGFYHARNFAFTDQFSLGIVHFHRTFEFMKPKIEYFGRDTNFFTGINRKQEFHF